MYPREILFPHKEKLGAVRMRVAAICAMLDHGEFQGTQFPNSEHYPFMTEYGFDFEDAPSYLNPQTFANIAPSGQLAIAVEKVISSMGQSISTGQLVPVQLRTSLNGVVDDKNTWLRLNDVAAWLKTRNITVGELFATVKEDEQRIFEAAVEAGDAARMQIEFVNSDSGPEMPLPEPDDPNWPELMKKRCSDLAAENAVLRGRLTEIEDDTIKTRGRKTLLTLVAALARAANFDIHTAGKTAIALENLTDNFGAGVSKRTIENYLNEIPDALRTRMK